MTRLQKQIKNQNDAQRAYKARLNAVKALAKKLERQLENQPAVGGWPEAGTMSYVEEQLTNLTDMLGGTGEYAR